MKSERYPKSPKGGSFKNKFPHISVVEKANDYKFAMQMRFAKAHRQMPLEEKVGVTLG